MAQAAAAARSRLGTRVAGSGSAVKSRVAGLSKGLYACVAQLRSSAGDTATQRQARNG